MISGVFYVYCESGLLTLHDPRLNAQRGYPNELQKYFEPKKIAPKTGDIILCHGYNQHGPDPGLDGLIEIFTHSQWEHAAIIIRDPWWTKEKLKGLYISPLFWWFLPYHNLYSQFDQFQSLQKL